MDERDLRKIVGLRHELHARPELSEQEAWTKRRIMGFLEDETTLAVVDCGRWAYAARYVEGTRAVAFRADMDALPMPEGLDVPHASTVPGVSHKCGHDGHCAALCGLALLLERIDCPRSVYLIFQHAEETGTGAVECAPFLPERHVSEVYALHNRSGYPEGSVVLRRGLCQCASKGLSVRMEGRPSHASEPEKGRSPVRALSELALFADELWKDAWHGMAFCTIVGLLIGGRDFGIAPGAGEVHMTLRADREADMEAFDAKIRTKALELAKGGGLRATFETRDAFPETLNDDACVDRAERVARSLGLDVIEMDEPWRASEDFGQFTKRAAGAMIYVGNGDAWPALHTSGYDFNDRILGTMAELLLGIYQDGILDA